MIHKPAAGIARTLTESVRWPDARALALRGRPDDHQVNMSIAGPMASMRKRPLSSIALHVWSRAILSLFAAAFELMSVRPFECPCVAAGVSRGRLVHEPGRSPSRPGWSV